MTVASEVPTPANGCVLIVGVGASLGTGAAIARRFARAGHPVVIAEAYYTLHTQHRSAWTQELDLRPWSESFQERCLP